MTRNGLRPSPEGTGGRGRVSGLLECYVVTR